MAKKSPKGTRSTVQKPPRRTFPFFIFLIPMVALLLFAVTRPNDYQAGQEVYPQFVVYVREQSKVLGRPSAATIAIKEIETAFDTHEIRSPFCPDVVVKLGFSVSHNPGKNDGLLFGVKPKTLDYKQKPANLYADFIISRDNWHLVDGTFWSAIWHERYHMTQDCRIIQQILNTHPDITENELSREFEKQWEAKRIEEEAFVYGVQAWWYIKGYGGPAVLLLDKQPKLGNKTLVQLFEETFPDHATLTVSNDGVILGILNHPAWSKWVKMIETLNK